MQSSAWCDGTGISYGEHQANNANTCADALFIFRIITYLADRILLTRYEWFLLRHRFHHTRYKVISVHHIFSWLECQTRQITLTDTVVTFTGHWLHSDIDGYTNSIKGSKGGSSVDKYDTQKQEATIASLETLRHPVMKSTTSRQCFYHQKSLLHIPTSQIYTRQKEQCCQYNHHRNVVIKHTSANGKRYAIRDRVSRAKTYWNEVLLGCSSNQPVQYCI